MSLEVFQRNWHDFEKGLSCIVSSLSCPLQKLCKKLNQQIIIAGQRLVGILKGLVIRSHWSYDTKCYIPIPLLGLMLHHSSWCTEVQRDIG